MSDGAVLFIRRVNGRYHVHCSACEMSCRSDCKSMKNAISALPCHSLAAIERTIWAYEGEEAKNESR